MENVQVYTVKDICKILSIGKSAAYKWLDNNPPFKVIKIGGAYRITKNSFDTWLNSAIKGGDLD